MAQKAQQLALGGTGHVDATGREPRQHFWEHKLHAQEVTHRGEEWEPQVRKTFIAPGFDGLLATTREERKGLMAHKAHALLCGKETAAGCWPRAHELEKEAVALLCKLLRITAREAVSCVSASVGRECLWRGQRGASLSPACQCSSCGALRHVLASIPEDGVHGDGTDRPNIIRVALVELAQGIREALTEGFDLGQALAQRSTATKAASGCSCRAPGGLEPLLGICELRAEVGKAGG
mmetsp:Transcript_29391/g.84430  ORF Transcript_29391/g.84430 Transcript_29391/m.84430 type:complete len:237 (+) Transcript_29391:759-1469(+)